MLHIIHYLFNRTESLCNNIGHVQSEVKLFLNDSKQIREVVRRVLSLCLLYKAFFLRFLQWFGWFVSKLFLIDPYFTKLPILFRGGLTNKEYL